MAKIESSPLRLARKKSQSSVSLALGTSLVARAAISPERTPKASSATRQTPAATVKMTTVARTESTWCEVRPSKRFIRTRF